MLTFPGEPYKGLLPYTENERFMFIGREHDSEMCTHFLGRAETRLLILHGQSGCGKSSFLRAALLPDLFEKSAVRYRIIPENNDIIWLTTYNPLGQIAAALYDFIHQAQIKPTSQGNIELRIADSFPDIPDRKGFISNVCREPIYLLQYLRQIDRKLFFRILFVFDQAEEILLYDYTKSEDYRIAFFDFLSHFINSDIKWIQFIVSLRTDHFGQFLSECSKRRSTSTAYGNYMLNALSREEMVNAIKLPTRDIEIPGYGNPHDYYKYSFEEGVPEAIVDNLPSRQRVSSAALPIMQIVCKTLYERTMLKADTLEWTIKLNDTLGDFDFSDYVMKYLDDVLSEILHEVKGQWSVKSELIKWKCLLSKFVYRDWNGTITSKSLSRKFLIQLGNVILIHSDIAGIIDRLCGESCQILRKRLVPNADYSEQYEWLRLSHDCLALYLESWNDKVAFDFKDHSLTNQLDNDAWDINLDSPRIAIIDAVTRSDNLHHDTLQYLEKLDYQEIRKWMLQFFRDKDLYPLTPGHIELSPSELVANYHYDGSESLKSNIEEAVNSLFLEWSNRLRTQPSKREQVLFLFVNCLSLIHSTKSYLKNSFVRTILLRYAYNGSLLFDNNSEAHLLLLRMIADSEMNFHAETLIYGRNNVDPRHFTDSSFLKLCLQILLNQQPNGPRKILKYIMECTDLAQSREIGIARNAKERLLTLFHSIDLATLAELFSWRFGNMSIRDYGKLYSLINVAESIGVSIQPSESSPTFKVTLGKDSGEYTLPVRVSKGFVETLMRIRSTISQQYGNEEESLYRSIRRIVDASSSEIVTYR